MKKLILIFSIIFFVFSGFSAFANDKTGSSWQTWPTGSAYLLPPHRIEIGLFQPLRYGFSESLEFSTHPLLFFVIPNFDVKWAHGEMGGFTITSAHGITYPSLLMDLVSKEGIGGLISPEFDIPHILSFQNALLASRVLFDDHLFTGKLALNFAVKSEKLDSRTTIDLPVTYPRMSVYYHDFGFRVGMDMKGPLFRRFCYVFNGELFYYPTAETDINSAFEHKGLLYWNKSSKFQICAGYLLSYCEYPFGTQWHLLPLLDAQWSWTW
ncbi:hypothetical protein JW935_20120 [candidate division KSB1 bacterium]|nr:hypothetical protein [candidate division KSB1 bacterium]